MVKTEVYPYNGTLPRYKKVRNYFIHTVTSLDLKGIMLNTTCLSQEATYCNFPLKLVLKCKITEKEMRLVNARN